MTKLTLVLFFALFAVSHNAAWPKPEPVLSPDGHCETGEGLTCSGTIIGPVMHCVETVGADNPQGIVQCVKNIIGTVDCVDCICEVLSMVGVNC